MKFKFGFLSGLNGCIFRMIVPKVFSSSIDVDKGSPSQIACMPSDSWISRLIVSVYRFVSQVFRFRADSQIRSAVIQSVSIVMVNLKCLVRYVKDCSVHGNMLWAVVIVSCFSESVKRFGRWIPMCEPRPLHQKVIVDGINQCCPALSQSDKPNGSIIWLSYFWTCPSGAYPAFAAIFRRFSHWISAGTGSNFAWTSWFFEHSIMISQEYWNVGGW